MIENNNSDDFDKLLTEFINNCDNGFSLTNNNEDTVDTQIEDDSNDDNAASHSNPDFITTIIKRHKYLVPKSSPALNKADYCGLRIKDGDVLENPYHTVFDSDTTDNDSIRIEVIDLPSEEDNVAKAYLYKEGKKKHIWDTSVNLNWGCVIIQLTHIIGKLQCGRYFMLFTGIDLENIAGAQKVGNAYIIPFQIIKPAERNFDLKTKTALLKKDNTLELHFDEAFGANSLFRAKCFTHDSLTYLGESIKLRRRGSSSLKIKLPDYGYGWPKGKYLMSIDCNQHFIGTIVFEKTENAWLEPQIFASNANPHFKNLHSLSLEKCDKTWLSFCSHPGYGDLKRYALNRISHRNLIMESKNAGVETLMPYMRIWIRSNRRTSALNIAKDLYNLIEHSSIDEIDCKTILSQREANGSKMMDEDLADKLNTSSKLLITNISALLNSRMSDIAQKIVQRAHEGEELDIIFVGSLSEEAAITEMYPTLTALCSDFIEIPPLTPTEATRVMHRILTEWGMIPSEEIMTEIIDKISHSGVSKNWSEGSIYNFLKNGMGAKRLQRLGCMLDRTPNFNDFSEVKIDDFDFAQFHQDADLTYNAAMKKLNSLVGLNQLKDKLNALFQQLRFFKMRNDAGFPTLSRASYHTIFTGNPGTGKTTVAKLMGKIYHALGIISKGEAIIVDRSRIVGQYIGDTEANMRNLIEQARGNILFIDEAYTLKSDPTDKRDFGGKALDVLLPILAQPNPDMVVILAGYEKEMETLIKSNPGLASRFSVNLHFPDYSATELLEITKTLIAANGFAIADSVLETLSEGIIKVVNNKPRDFGNARWAEQLVEHGIIPAMASRVMQLDNPTVSDLSCIAVEDVQSALRNLSPVHPSVSHLGFH